MKGVDDDGKHYPRPQTVAPYGRIPYHEPYVTYRLMISGCSRRGIQWYAVNLPRSSFDDYDSRANRFYHGKPESPGGAKLTYPEMDALLREYEINEAHVANFTFVRTEDEDFMRGR